MTNYLGGMTVLGVGWAGPQSVYVDFDSQYLTGWLWQLYVNRQLAGTTRYPTERRIMAGLVPSGVPAVITLLRVPAAEILTDFGSEIPSGPFNRYKLTWSESGADADLDHWDVTMGTEAGGDPDPDTIVGRVPFYGDGSYQFVLPPIDDPGPWKYAVTPRDNATPYGNAGTPVGVEIPFATPPRDVQIQSDGSRFTATIAAGVLSVEFAYGGAA